MGKAEQEESVLRLLEAGKVYLVEEATAAVKALTEASAEAGRHGAEVLVQISEVGRQMAAGEIDERSGRMSLDNYLEALKLRGYGLTTLAQVEAFKRGERLLARLGTIGIAILDVALSVAVPGAARLFDGLVTRASGERGDA